MTDPVDADGPTEKALSDFQAGYYAGRAEGLSQERRCSADGCATAEPDESHPVLRSLAVFEKKWADRFAAPGTEG